MKRLIACVLVSLLIKPVTVWGVDKGDPAETPAAISAQQALRVTPVVLAYRKSRQAVVNIVAEKLARTRRLGLFGDSFFNRGSSNTFVKTKSIGSGVVISDTGYIVTNAHVVSRAQTISVEFADKSRYRAKVISTMASQDLAILKLDLPAGKKVKHIPLGRSDDIMVGETVIAIGNAMGYAGTLSTGVISAASRTLKFNKEVSYDNLIQTDAPINPGNSGGALLNIRGEFIGINTAIRADAQNIGFAISADTLAQHMPHLLDYERINRVIVGMTVAQRIISGKVELRIERVTPGSPAAGKLRAGDVLLELDGKPLGRIPDYVCAMMEVKAGRQVAFKVRRRRKIVETKLTVKSRPKPDGKKLAASLMGLRFKQVDRTLAGQRGLAIGWGLMIVGVEAGSSADRIGLRLGDVVFQVGHLYVKDMDSLAMILEDVKAGKGIRIGAVRGNLRYWATIRCGPRKSAPGRN